MLTDAVIKGLRPRAKQYKVADQFGLYLLVKPNGSKLWRLKYYIEGIEKAPLAFGVYPDVTLKRAREKQAEARRLLDQKVDPAAQRRQEKEAAQRAYIAAKVHTYSAIALRRRDEARRAGALAGDDLQNRMAVEPCCVSSA